MLFLFTILVVLSAVAALVIFTAKRRNSNLLEQNPPKIPAVQSFRPLFQPTEDEIRAFEREEQARADAKKAESARQILIAKAEKMTELEKSWSAAPDRNGTIELLLRASESENAKIFAQTADKIIKLWRENRIENLTALDLADLLDSHFRILPQQERTSGAIFRLKQEIESLRSEVRGN